MPIIEAGLSKEDGTADNNRLIVYGPTVTVSVDHFFADEASQEDAEYETVYALVDTGAAESCIDEVLAQKLGLPAVDMQTISGVGGAEEYTVYMAKINALELGFTQYGRFAGVHLLDGDQPHKALLGRTFLQNTIMIYDGLRSQVTIAAPK